VAGGAELTLYVGTSGWQYRDWRGAFYPPKLAQKAWLEFYAERFQTVEVNNTFYNLPEASVFEAWARRTPDDFVVTVKMSRFLTHLKRLLEPEEPVERFFDRASKLGRKLGPVLLQLPPGFEADPPRLDHALEVLPEDVLIAVEFRHRSWYTEEVRSVLERHGAALCWADRRRPLDPPWRTAPFGFVRFHEGRSKPRPCYGHDALETWVERIASSFAPGEDVFAYFNNDHRCCAVRDAAEFARTAARAGLDTTRVPEPGSVTLATD
jgi:uncharacterized protein YecE (DUF72 family)